MVDSKRIQEFWSHWEHEPNTTEEFKRFRIRITEVSRKLWDDFFENMGTDGTLHLFSFTF
jgi:hypothetical protein